MYADAGSCFEMMITTKVNHWLCLTRIGHYFDKLRYICVIRNHVNMGEDLYIYWPCLMMIVMYISLLHIKVIPHDLKIYACQIFIFLRTIGQYSIKISTRGTGCILCLPVPSWGSFLGSSPYHCLWQGDNKRWKRLSPPHWGIHCAKVRPLCVYVDNCTMGIKLSCNWTCSWQCYCQCD